MGYAVIGCDMACHKVDYFSVYISHKPCPKVFHCSYTTNLLFIILFIAVERLQDKFVPVIAELQQL